MAVMRLHCPNSLLDVVIRLHDIIFRNAPDFTIYMLMNNNISLPWEGGHLLPLPQIKSVRYGSIHSYFHMDVWIHLISYRCDTLKHKA